MLIEILGYLSYILCFKNYAVIPFIHNDINIDDDN